MSDDHLPGSDVGLEHAENLIARVLNFVTSDEARLAHFLRVTGMRPERMREPGLRSFVLDVIDLIAADTQLLAALLKIEQIRPEDIYLARARLSFEVSAGRGYQEVDDPADRAIRERVKQLLRALALLIRERQESGDRRSA
jgi:hypothetical protein